MGGLIGKNNLQARTVAPDPRLVRKVTQRPAVLTYEELNLLSEAPASERGHLMWAAACRQESAGCARYWSY